jgi:putative thioredoxin
MSNSDTGFVLDVTAAEFRATVVDGSLERPVLVDFWAAWCAPCRALGPILERLAAEYAGGFVLAKLDTEKEQALAAQFQIRSIPTVLLFVNGKPVDGFSGALPEGQIRTFLSKHGVEPGGSAALTLSDDPAVRVTELREAIAAHPTRESLRLDLALAVLASGDVPEAHTLLEALPAALYADARAARARAEVALRDQQAKAPAAHAAAIGQLLAGDATGGVDALVELLRDEKQDEHSPARAALVEALHYIADEAVVRDGRRRMASVLF